MLFFGSAQSADAPALGGLHRAAEKGAAAAQLELASYYMMGKGIAQDPKIARVWYEKAANQGNLKAQTILGLLYANGTGVKPDAVMAAKWLKRAALQGVPTAQLTLGAFLPRARASRRIISSHISGSAWQRRNYRQERLAASRSSCARAYRVKCPVNKSTKPKIRRKAFGLTRRG